MIEGKHTSFWLDKRNGRQYSKRIGDKEYDVAVIGGGICGVMSANILANNGLKVILLESRKIGGGVSGKTTAKITMLQGLKYHRIASKYGKEKALMYARGQQEGLNTIRQMVSKLKIDCNLTKRSAWTYTNNENKIREVEKEFKTIKELGLPVLRENEITELPYKIKAAVGMRNQASFDPIAFIDAVAKDTIDRGGKIVEDSRVVGMESKSKGIELKIMGNKTVLAKEVVVTTHFPIFDRGLYFARQIPRRAYVIVAKALKNPIKGMYINTGEEIFSHRLEETDSGDWYVITGQSHITGHKKDTWQFYQRLLKTAKDRLGIKEADYFWSTQDNYTFDGIPFVGRYSPIDQKLWVATGMGGWGMSNGVAGAVLLSDLIMGRKNEWGRVFSSLRLGKGEGLINRNLHVGKTYIRSKVTQVSSEKVKICSHMGCKLGFNVAEGTWDCPCHGSRFDKKGKVIHSPAVKDIKT